MVCLLIYITSMVSLAYLLRKLRIDVQILIQGIVLFLISLSFSISNDLKLSPVSFDPLPFFLVIPLLISDTEVFIPITRYSIPSISLLLPASEEMVFRGCLMKEIGLLPSSVLFSAFHLLNVLTGIEKFQIYPLLARFLVGWVFGVVTLSSGSLFPAILFHSAINTLAIASRRG